MTGKVEEHRLSERIVVRIGYDDAHVEVEYAPTWPLPKVKFTIDASELAGIPEIFQKAKVHAEKVKGAERE